MKTPSTILIVEDESIIAMDLEDLAQESGCVAISASTEAMALKVLSDAHVDFAILDIGLRGTRQFGVAERLLARHIPFAFCSGSANQPPAKFARIPFIAKPFGIDAILSLLAPYGPGGAHV